MKLTSLQPRVPPPGKLAYFKKYKDRLLTNDQKKFTDAINGKSNLSYADALASEVCCPAILSPRSPADTTSRTIAWQRSRMSSPKSFAIPFSAKYNFPPSAAWTSSVCVLKLGQRFSTNPLSQSTGSTTNSSASSSPAKTLSSLSRTAEWYPA